MVDETAIDPAQCRAARALIGWTQAELAADAHVGVNTVKRFEAGGGLRSAQAAAVRRSLEGRGVAFLDDPSVCNGMTTSFGVVLITAPERS